MIMCHGILVIKTFIKFTLAMKNLILTLIISLGFSQFSMAASHDHSKHNHKEHKHGKEHSMKDHAVSANVLKDKAIIKVEGMVCAFCAQGVEKNFSKRKEVKGVAVSLDKMEVRVTLKEGQKICQGKK